MSDGYLVYRPTLLERFWRRVGYGTISIPEFAESAVGEIPNPGWCRSEIKLHLSFWHRLLVLFTGRINVTNTIEFKNGNPLTVARSASGVGLPMPFEQ